MIKAVIIDDVAEARQNLRADLQDYCQDVSVLGEAEGVVSGAKLLRQVKPDVVFLDIQMPDGSGFDLLDILGTVAFKVIFTTASDAFAIRAFRFSAVDYLLKPIDPDELVAAVRKLKANPEPSPDTLHLLARQLQQPQPERLALNTQDKIHIAEIANIVRCESQGNYTMFYFHDGGRMLVTKTLKEYDNLLSSHRFLRVHQSHLINLRFLREFVKTDGGYLVMKDQTQVPVSSRKRHQVLEVIERL